MMRMVRNERGIALAIAIVALVVVGALVAGAFFAGTQEQRVAENAKRVSQSFGVAEVGLNATVDGWDPQVNNSRGTYPTDSITIASTGSPGRSGAYGGYVYKLNPNLYLVDTWGRDSASIRFNLTSGGARQRLGLITRIRPLEINMQASLTTQGSVTLQGNAEVDGTDQIPTGWTDCAAPDTNKAGIRTTGTVTTGGQATVNGDPPVWTDPSLTDSMFHQFGDVSYDELAARATITLPGGNYKTAPVVVGGVCDKSDLTNWGDGLNPTGACGSYMPIIHVRGDLTLNGDQGQGILLVDGNMDVQGSYEFFGIVIVQGDIKTAGGGTSQAHFWGGVMARNADIELQKLSGKATLNYSKCAIVQALQATGITSPLRSRGWVQLF
jgi:hypothetical protein